MSEKDSEHQTALIMFERSLWLFEKHFEQSDLVSEKISRVIVVLGALGAALAFVLTFSTGEVATTGRTLVLGGFTALLLLGALWKASALALPSNSRVPGYKMFECTVRSEAGLETVPAVLLRDLARSNLTALDGIKKDSGNRITEDVQLLRRYLIACAIGVAVAGASRMYDLWHASQTSPLATYTASGGPNGGSGNGNGGGGSGSGGGSSEDASEVLTKGGNGSDSRK